MGSAAKRRAPLEGIAAVAATSAMLYWGNGMEPIWPLVWCAWIPLLWFALRAPWWAAASASVGAMLLGNLNLWSYFTHTIGMPGSIWLGISSVVALAFAAAVLLFRGLVLRGGVWSGLVAFPSLWVTLEYARNFATPHGTAGSLAYSQLGFLPFLQLASIAGPWGMTFVLLMTSCAVAIWLHLRKSNPNAVRVLAVAIAILAAVLGFGAARCTEKDVPSVRIGLIASDLQQNSGVVSPGAETERLFRAYAQVAEQLAHQGAQVIVIPEKLGVMIEGQSLRTDALLQSLADKTGATLIGGVVQVDGTTRYNQARVYLPGKPVQTYDKEHMLPPFESDLKPGTALTLLPPPHQHWGVAICKDMDFASPARLYGKAGAGLLLVPAWDFVVDRGWHGHMAIMRGVEDGFSVVRAAKDGYLTVSDDRGRILAETRSNAAPYATLLVNAPEDHHWTVYQVLGDWFAWVAVALLGLVLVQSARLSFLRKSDARPSADQAMKDSANPLPPLYSNAAPPLRVRK